MNLTIRNIEYRDVSLYVGRYMADNTLFIQVNDREEEEVIARLTVCLDVHGLETNCSFVDINNFPGAVAFIEENGLGKMTGLFRQSGYVLYPLCEFDMEKLRECSLEVQA